MEIIILAYGFFLSFLMIYSFCTLNLALLFKKGFLDKKQDALLHLDLKNLPFVSIQLPIFNEKYVVERLVKKISEIDYPKNRFEIQLLDDSTDETVDICRKLSQDLKEDGFLIEHIHRKNRNGFKAGALKDSLEQAKGEFIVIFDADFLPKKDFLKKMLPYFSDPKIGLVQSRWQHLNEDYSALTKAQALALDGHFVVEQTARNVSGYFINFNGTAGVWRKETILDAGNWHDDTITEDLDLSFRAQLKGWKFKYLTDYTTPAELPAEINAFKSQQYRWTKGAIETAKKLMPQIWNSSLPLSTKLQCSYHLTNNMVYVAILAVALLNLPLIYIKTQFQEFSIHFIVMSIFSLSFIGPFLLYYFSQRAAYPDWKKRMLSFPLFMSGSMGLTLNNAKAVWDGLVGKRTSFVRTPKFNIHAQGDSFHTKSYKAKLKTVVVFELIMTIYTFLSLSIAIYYAELAAIPFHFMFFFGFSLVSYLSLKHHFSYRFAK